MYRPGGMKENPFKRTIEDVNKAYPKGIPKGYHILQEAGSNEGFEAGADAMLEGLKKDALTPHDISKPIPSDPAMLVFSVPDREGYLVFIKEGKE